MSLVEGFRQRYERAASLSYVRAVPPLPGQPRNSWMTVGGSLTNPSAIHPAVKLLAAISTAYNRGTRLTSTKQWPGIGPGSRKMNFTPN